MSSRKRTKIDGDEEDSLLSELQALKEECAKVREIGETHLASYFASKDLLVSLEERKNTFPVRSHSAAHVREFIVQQHELDFKPRLNTSSYVNVVFEEQEKEVAMIGATINIADASVYPASIKIHDACVNMLGDLWNVPGVHEGGSVSGAGTVSAYNIYHSYCGIVFCVPDPLFYSYYTLFLSGWIYGGVPSRWTGAQISLAQMVRGASRFDRRRSRWRHAQHGH